MSENFVFTLDTSQTTGNEHVTITKNRHVHATGIPSKNELRLNHIIHEIDELAAEDLEDNNIENVSKSACLQRIEKSRKFLRHILEKPEFHYTVIILIIIDLIAVFVDLVLGK